MGDEVQSGERNKGGEASPPQPGGQVAQQRVKQPQRAPGIPRHARATQQRRQRQRTAHPTRLASIQCAQRPPSVPGTHLACPAPSRGCGRMRRRRQTGRSSGRGPACVLRGGWRMRWTVVMSCFHTFSELCVRQRRGGAGAARRRRGTIDAWRPLHASSEARPTHWWARAQAARTGGPCPTLMMAAPRCCTVVMKSPSR